MIRTNVRIYIRDQYIRMFEYLNIFVTLWWGLYSKVVAEIKSLYSKVVAQVRIVLGDPAWQLKLRSVLLFTAGHHHPYHHPHAQSIFQKIWNSIRRISNAVFSDHFNAMQINRIDFSWMWTILTPYIWILGRDHICHKQYKQRLCKIIITRVKVHFVDVF